MTFDEYKQAVEKENGECQILHAQNTHNKKNCGKTGDRNAPKGVSWIDYWRAMTGNHESRLFCSSCGQVIFVGDVPKIMKDLYVATGDTVEQHRAIGGHVKIEKPRSGQYPGGNYITPLCPVCNAKRGEVIPIIKGSRVCKELGAHIEEGE